MHNFLNRGGGRRQLWNELLKKAIGNAVKKPKKSKINQN
jgi:hypothetical protein